MKLCSLQIENVRGVPNGTYSFAAQGTQAPLDVVLVTGGPSSGKTSMLEAIAAAKESAGSYGGRAFEKNLLRSGGSNGRIEARWAVSEHERRQANITAAQPISVLRIEERPRFDVDPGLRRLFSTYTLSSREGKFEYFPDNRRLSTMARPPSSSSSDASFGRLRLTRDPDKYGWLRGELFALALAGAARLAQTLETQGVALRTDMPDVLAPYRDAIASLLPDLRLASVEPQDKGALVWFSRRGGARVELDDLSASEQQGVLFGSAFVRLGLHRSVLLIDTPELFVHPRRQAAFFAGLTQLGEDNQIIAATSSPELLAAVRPEQVIDLDRS